MRRVRQSLRCAGVVVAIVVLTGCTYEAAVQQLSPPERAAFHAYSNMMRAGQVWNYLSKQTPAERAAYLEAIGVAQRFQALDAQDRDTVLAGFPRKGMSADALRFLWGEPYYTTGYTGRYEHWYYQGSTFSLAQYGNHRSLGGTQVQVSLANGRVEWWLEFVPTMEPNEGGGCDGC